MPQTNLYWHYSCKLDFWNKQYFICLFDPQFIYSLTMLCPMLSSLSKFLLSLKDFFLLSSICLYHTRRYGLLLGLPQRPLVFGQSFFSPFGAKKVWSVMKFWAFLGQLYVLSSKQRKFLIYIYTYILIYFFMK